LGLIRYEHSITVGHWHRHNDEFHIFLSFVCQSVWHPSRNMPSLTRSQAQELAFNLQTGGTREHKEELPGMLMVMPDLGTSRRDTLLDNTEFRRSDQMPAIALLTPGIMLGVVLADYSPCHIGFAISPFKRPAQEPNYAGAAFPQANGI
jgi:hypothetical protein